MSDEMARMNKGFMRKDGKFFLPITHESLVVDNNGVSIKDKYLPIDGIDGYATEDYVKEAILGAQLGGAEVDLSKFATVEQLEKKADKSEIPVVDVDKAYVDEQIDAHTHDEYATEQFVTDKISEIDLSTSHTHINKAVLDTITLANINNWDSKSDFSGSYNDLTDKPDIPSVEGLATQEFVDARIATLNIPTVDVDKAYVDEQIATRAHRIHTHSYEDLEDLPEIPSIEGLATEDFVLEEIAKVQVGEDVDLSGYAKLTDLDSKANVDHTHEEYLTEHQDISGLATIEYVDEKIAGIEIPEQGSAYDDSALIARLDVLESIDHEAFLTEHQDISHLAAQADVDEEIARAQEAEAALDERVDVLETLNLETKPYIDKNGMLVLCGCPAIAKGVDDEVHVTIRFYQGEEDKFVFTADEFAKTRICMGYGAEGVGAKRNIVETTLELYDIDKVFIIDGGSQVTGEIGTVNIIAERCNYIDGIQGARAMEGGERNVVHNFNVKVKDCTLIDTLFGGGNGYSVVWNSNVEVDGETVINYLVAGGSNGYTRKSHVVLNNGSIKVMQGVNRGILDRAELIVNGGEVQNFYVGGENDPSVTGVQYEGYVELNAGTIKNFYPGTSGLVEFENIEGTITDCIVENGDVSMLVKIEKETEPDYASKEYVDEAIAAIPECKVYDDSALVARVETLEAIEHHAQPNFTYKINMIAADQEASVTTTGEFPDLVITFNIPMGSGSSESGDDVVDTGTPRMWYGWIPYDETGAAGFSTEEEIGAAMDKTVIQFGLDNGSLTETDPQAFDSKQGLGTVPECAYMCGIVPVNSNLVVYYDNAGEKRTFNSLNADAFMFSQDGLELTNPIDGVYYRLYGTYLTGGALRYLWICEE